jgi:hypothetical protein
MLLGTMFHLNLSNTIDVQSGMSISFSRWILILRQIELAPLVIEIVVVLGEGTARDHFAIQQWRPGGGSSNIFALPQAKQILLWQVLVERSMKYMISLHVLHSVSSSKMERMHRVKTGNGNICSHLIIFLLSVLYRRRREKPFYEARFILMTRVC